MGVEYTILFGISHFITVGLFLSLWHRHLIKNHSDSSDFLACAKSQPTAPRYARVDMDLNLPRHLTWTADRHAVLHQLIIQPCAKSIVNASTPENRR